MADEVLAICAVDVDVAVFAGAVVFLFTVEPEDAGEGQLRQPSRLRRIDVLGAERGCNQWDYLLAGYHLRSGAPAITTMVKELKKTEGGTKCRAGMMPALHFFEHNRLRQPI